MIDIIDQAKVTKIKEDFKTTYWQKIKTIEIDGEKVHLKKDKIFGWKEIDPIINEQGKKNWAVALYGGKRGLIRTGIYLLITLIIFYGIHTQLQTCKDFAANPCKYLDCQSLGVAPGSSWETGPINFSSAIPLNGS